MTESDDATVNVLETRHLPWYSRYAMFMNYVSWTSLRLSVKIDGKGSRDAFKEAQAGSAKGLLLLVNIVPLLILAKIIFSIENKHIGKSIFFVSGIFCYCIFYWLDSFQEDYFRLFEKTSIKERKKWDLYALTYIAGTFSLLLVVALLIYPRFIPSCT